VESLSSTQAKHGVRALGRSAVAARLVQLTGTRAGGFVLTRQEPAGKWGAATYSLARTGKA
jgi:hypothetical protein